MAPWLTTAVRQPPRRGPRARRRPAGGSPCTHARLPAPAEFLPARDVPHQRADRCPDAAEGHPTARPGYCRCDARAPADRRERTPAAHAHRGRLPGIAEPTTAFRIPDPPWSRRRWLRAPRHPRRKHSPTIPADRHAVNGPARHERELRRRRSPPCRRTSRDPMRSARHGAHPDRGRRAVPRGRSSRPARATPPTARRHRDRRRRARVDIDPAPSPAKRSATGRPATRFTLARALCRPARSRSSHRRRFRSEDRPRRHESVALGDDGAGGAHDLRCRPDGAGDCRFALDPPPALGTGSPGGLRGALDASVTVLTRCVTVLTRCVTVFTGCVALATGLATTVAAGPRAAVIVICLTAVVTDFVTAAVVCLTAVIYRSGHHFVVRLTASVSGFVTDVVVFLTASVTASSRPSSSS